MTFNSPRDPRLNPNDPPRTEPPSRSGGWVPILIAVAIVVAVFAIVRPHNPTPAAVGATNAGPPVQTVEPTPSPAVPTPNPMTEPPPAPPPQP